MNLPSRAWKFWDRLAIVRNTDLVKVFSAWFCAMALMPLIQVLTYYTLSFYCATHWRNKMYNFGPGIVSPTQPSRDPRRMSDRPKLNIRRPKGWGNCNIKSNHLCIAWRRHHGDRYRSYILPRSWVFMFVKCTDDELRILDRMFIDA